MTDFCKGCGIKLPDAGFLEGVGGFLVGGQQKIHEFEEGKYCDKCAKIRVEKHRKKL